MSHLRHLCYLRHLRHLRFGLFILQALCEVVGQPARDFFSDKVISLSFFDMYDLDPNSRQKQILPAREPASQVSGHDAHKKA